MFQQESGKLNFQFDVGFVIEEPSSKRVKNVITVRVSELGTGKQKFFLYLNSVLYSSTIFIQHKEILPRYSTQHLIWYVITFTTSRCCYYWVFKIKQAIWDIYSSQERKRSHIILLLLLLLEYYIQCYIYINVQYNTIQYLEHRGGKTVLTITLKVGLTHSTVRKYSENYNFHLLNKSLSLSQRKYFKQISILTFYFNIMENYDHKRRDLNFENWIYSDPNV